MRITSTHRLTFVVDHKEFTTAGKNTAEEAPDWIAQDDYFRMNERAGRVTVLGEAPKTEAPEEKPAGKGKGKKKAESEDKPEDQDPPADETETEDQTEGSNDLDDL